VYVDVDVDVDVDVGVGVCVWMWMCAGAVADAWRALLHHFFTTVNSQSFLCSLSGLPR
jgi:hypothetical protein